MTKFVYLSLVAAMSFALPSFAAQTGNNSGATQPGATGPNPIALGTLSPFICPTTPDADSDDESASAERVTGVCDPLNPDKKISVISAYVDESGETPDGDIAAGGVWTGINKAWDNNSSMSLVWRTNHESCDRFLVGFQGKNDNNVSITVYLDQLNFPPSTYLGNGWYQTTFTNANTANLPTSRPLRHIKQLVQFEGITYDYDPQTCAGHPTCSMMGDVVLTLSPKKFYGPNVSGQMYPICPESLCTNQDSILYSCPEEGK
jgi:hypothetical protein